MVSPFQQVAQQPQQQPQQQAPSVPTSPFAEFAAKQERMSLWQRAKNVAYGRGVLAFTKDPVKPGDIGEANTIAAQRSMDQARQEILGDLTPEQAQARVKADPELLSRMHNRSMELHDSMYQREILSRQRPGWRHQIEAGETIPTGETPPPESPAEKAVELGVGMATELTKLAVLRKAAPNVSPAVLFEAINIAEDGTPGRGFVVGQTLSTVSKAITIGHKVLDGIAQPGAAGILFASMTAIEGGSSDDIAISFAMPYLVKAVNMKHGTKGSHMSRMKAEMKREGMDPSRLTKDVTDKMWNLAGRIQKLQMDMKEGKISRNEFNAGMQSAGREAEAIRTVFRKPVKLTGPIVDAPKPAAAAPKPAAQPAAPKPAVAVTYAEAQKSAAPNQNIIVPATTQPPKAGKRMAVQFSSDLLTEGNEDPLARQYYDMLHLVLEGYEIPGDTWEIPAWIPTLANIDPSAEMGIVRDPQTFVQQAIEGGYDTLYFSALDVNKEQIRNIAEQFPGKVIVGGYVDKAFFKDVPNVVFYDSMEAMAKAEGLSTKPGQDFRHFSGTKTQPRLCLSGGCLHKCAFCGVDKKLTARTHRDIINQVRALEKAGLEFKYVYLDDKTFGQSANSRLLGDIQKRIQKFNPNFEGFIIQTTAAQFNRMDPAQLREHGVRLVELGVESYNDSILKKYHKPASEKSIDKAVQKIREGGLTFIPNIIIGMPEETAETYARTLDFLRRNADIISHVNVYNLAVYANTELGKEIKIDTLTDVNENSVVKSFHKNPQIHLDFAKQVYEFAMEQLQKDVIGQQAIAPAPLGAYQTPAIDTNLRSIGDDEFIKYHNNLEQEVIKLEKQSDESDVDLLQDRAFRSKLADLQSKLKSADLEAFRRKITWEDADEIAYLLRSININSDTGKIEALILVDEVAKRPEIQDEIKDILNRKAAENPDWAEVIGEQLRDLKKLKGQHTAPAPQAAAGVLDNLNPTGSLFADYTPEARATMPLGENITTLDKTMGKSPDETITIYRGGAGGEIVAGDFVTTNKQLAKDYAGTGVVVEKTVKLSDVLDDKTEPLGEEYIYRPAEEPKLEQDPIQRRLSNLYKKNAHEWARRAGLDDEARRQINKELTGKTSMKDMDMDEQRLVADHFRKLAAGEKPAYGMPDILDTIGVRSTKYAAIRMRVEEIMRPLAEGQSKYKAELRETTRAKDQVINAYLANPGVVTPEQMWELLNAHRDAPAWMEGPAKELFDFISDMRANLLQRMNVERVARGDEAIEDAYAYMQRVLKPQTVKDILAGRLEMPKDTGAWMRGVKQNFNPQELERKLEEEVENLFSHDLKYVTDSMVRCSLRDIHLGTPRKLLDQILTGRVSGIDRSTIPDYLQKHVDHASEMPAETREWVQEIIRTVFEGEQTKLDQTVERDAKAALASVEKLLNKFGKSMGDKPATRLLQSLGTLVHYGALGPRPKLLIRNKFQTIQNLGISGAWATFQAITTANPPELNNLLDNSPFLRDYGTEAWVDADVAKRIGRGYMAAYRWTAVSNAKTAMEASWHSTLPLFTDPQHKGLGWADPQRTYTEPENFLYPSEQERMLLEMENAAGASQYAYTMWESPQIFRHKALGPITKLQSWPMNYWTRFMAEQWHRAYHGSPSWNPDLKLPMSHRLRTIQYLIIAGVLAHLLGYGRSYLLGTAPTGLPPTAQFLMSLYQYTAQIGNDSDYAKRIQNQAVYKMKQSALMHIPGYLTVKDAKAWIDVAEGERSWQELFFYKKIFGEPDTETEPGKPKQGRGREAL